MKTFDDFRDEPESPFYVADGLSPQATWNAVTEAMRTAFAELAANPPKDAPTPEDIRQWHARIFEGTFPEMAGRVREPGSDSQSVTFGITIGTRDHPVVKQCRGTGAKRIGKRLERATREFARATASTAPVGLGEVAFFLARLYAKILSIHPFIDGNLRTAYVVLQHASFSAGIGRGITFADYHDHDWAIGAALRPDGKQSYAPLASLIERAIRSPAKS